jgi:DNA-binding transcriptional LysR family regulator
MVQLFKDAVDVMGVSAGEDAPRPSLEEAHARLRAGPLIYAGRVTQCREIIEMLASEGLLPARRLSCGDLELVKSLALAGLGVALLPRRVAAYGHTGKLRRLHPTLPCIPDTICLVYRADIHRTKAALRVKDALVAHGRMLDELEGGAAPTSVPAPGGAPVRP